LLDARPSTLRWAPAFGSGWDMPTESASLAVLVIDDEPLIRWALSEALAQAGHAVVEASDGAGGLREVMTAARPFDVIFLDFRLPDSNDFTLLHAIRICAPPSAVVLMTASGTPELVADAYRLGAYNVLDKPFDIAAVQNLVSAAASRDQRGEFHGSTRHQPVSVSVSMDLSWLGNAAGGMDIRHLHSLQ
jgi:DNA-binding NtrC family response regulator